MDALLLLVPLEKAKSRIGGGDFSLNGRHLRRGGDFVYTGAQIIRLSALDQIAESAFSLNAVWDRLEGANRLGGAVYPGTWMDIGTPEGLEAANTFIARRDV